MPKSKHRRKGKLRKGNASASSRKKLVRKKAEQSSELFLMPDPLSRIPREALREAIHQTGKDAQTNYPVIRSKTEHLLNQFEPLHVLSVIASCTLFAGLDEAGEVTGDINATGLQQAHVELAQAITLRTRHDATERRFCTPQDFEEIFSALHELGDTFTQLRFTQIKKAKTDEEKCYLQLSERLRLHTHYVRNWGHYQEVTELLDELYSPLDKQYKRVAHLSATSIIRLFRYMVATVEERSSSIFQSLSHVVAGGTKRQKIERYYEVFPDLEDGPDQFHDFVKKHRVSKQGLLSIILSHTELRYPQIFTFTLRELAEHVAEPLDDVRAGLLNLAYSFGDLASNNFDHLFLSNPVWEKPLIALDNDDFFCLIPQLYFAFSHHIMGKLLSGDNKARKSLERRRSTFLENKIERLFKAAFPEAQIIRSQKWRLSEKQYETDLLVKIDSHLIIVEAKSGKVPWVALRGGIERAKTRIKDLIADPAEQAHRLEKALLGKQRGDDIELKIELPFELDEVHRIIKLAVTLEDFATIQSNTANLARLGVMPEGIPAVATMNIADLKVVLELLDTEAERIHYLDRRNEIQASVKYFGDEMDLLAFYFKKGFVFGQFEDGETLLNLLPMSQPIDDYYQSVHHGGNPAKPARLMTKWFRDICDFLSKRKVQCWTEMATVVLSIDYQDQKKLEVEFKKICRVLKKTGHPTEDQINTVMCIPAEGGKYGVVFVAFFEEERADRHNIIGHAASQIFDQSSVERCLVMARDLDGKDYPYTTLVVTTP